MARQQTDAASVCRVTAKADASLRDCSDESALSTSPEAQKLTGGAAVGSARGCRVLHDRSAAGLHAA